MSRKLHGPHLPSARRMEYNTRWWLFETLGIAIEVIMSAPLEHVDEAAVLSSLCGMTLAGLQAMQLKTTNTPIRHLILQVIELKEEASRKVETRTRKPRSKKTRQPG